jgi:hypothetical protein
MSPAILRTCIILVLLSSILVLWTARVGEESRDVDWRLNSSVGRPTLPSEAFDEPHLAAEYHRMKRRGLNPEFDTVAAYTSAHAHVEAMPRYSTQHQIRGATGAR